ncbi:MAG: DinB family protein [Bacteroidota bacterium]
MSKFIDSLVDRLKINQYIINAQLDGFSDEDALIQPAMRGNCANWILGHIIYGRNTMLERLGEETFWGEEHRVMYAFGSEAITSADSPHIAYSELMPLLESTLETIIACLEKMTEEDLDAPIRDTTLGESFSFLVWHEAYHSGQFEYLRQLTGADDQVP